MTADFRTNNTVYITGFFFFERGSYVAYIGLQLFIQWEEKITGNKEHKWKKILKIDHSKDQCGSDYWRQKQEESVFDRFY